MAKSSNITVKLLSTAKTGYFYVAARNPKKKIEKLVCIKYDPVIRKHVEFREAKIK